MGIPTITTGGFNEATRAAGAIGGRDGLRDLALQIANVARAHCSYSQAHAVVQNCCDHLCAIARVHELTVAVGTDEK